MKSGSKRAMLSKQRAEITSTATANELIAKGQNMKPHEERVVAESNELRQKLAKLTEFIGSGPFKTLNVIDRDLLVSQRVLMQGYLDVLGSRIRRFL